MNCFNCGVTLYTGEETECRLCGVKFAARCSSCGFPSSAAADYCFHCGTKITKLNLQSSVQNFNTLTENRKNVAVIFADISGFTALSEKMDPEEVREIINDCFSYITKPVYELEGTIDKYIGDCVMILFGAKYSHSDDAKRAVICAMKMMSMIESFSEERLSQKGYSLSLSIGVNYGLVVTGSVGNYFDKDYTVIGDIVNTAQRLQSNAAKGNILVSESVYIETKDMISYSEVREVAAKNKKNPVRCYSPISFNTNYVYENDMSFVDRESEIGLLNSIYNNVLNSSTQCVNIIGEAGIGKTRIVQEFTSRLGSDVKRIWADCSPTSQNKVYHVISNILTDAMNMNIEDNAGVKQHRLMSFIDYILNNCTDEEKKRNYNFLSLVLGLERDNEFQNILNSMTFDNIKREILRQISTFFIQLCRKHKVVVVVDDIHWADTSSMYIIKELIGLLSVVNATFIFSSRQEIPEFNSLEEWKYHTLELGTLSEAGTKALACKMLQCNDINDTLFDSIIKFTKGNPLYIREFISNIKRANKYFTKDGVAYTKIEEPDLIPASIQNLILANLSELDDATRSFLQVASVVGRDFNLYLVAGLLGFNPDEINVVALPVHLNIIALKSVYTSDGEIEKIYTFNQDMEREVIYDSLLNSRKKEFHKKIGEYIETRYAKDIENYYETLCSHFSSAVMNKKAGEYYFKTALKHKNDFNFHSSLEYYHRFLELPELSEEDMRSRMKHALVDMGQISLMMADYGAALSYLNQALEMADLSDDIYSIKIMIAEVYKEQDAYEQAMEVIGEIELKVRQESSIYGKILKMKSDILYITGDPKALSFAKRSEKILLKTKEYQSLAETMNQAGILYFIKGDINNSLFYMNKSYSYAEKVNNLGVMGKVSGNLGVILHATGMISKAQEVLKRTIEISKKISDPLGNISGGINLSILYMDKGLFNKAEDLLHEAMELSLQISSKLNEPIILTNLGDVMYSRGLYDEALQFYNQSLESAKSIHVPVGEGINYISIVKVYLKKERNEEIPKLLDSAFSIFNEAGEIIYLCDYYRYMGAYELYRDNTALAMEHCEKSVENSVECRNESKRSKALRLKGYILARTGSLDKALKAFDEAILLAEHLDSGYEAAKGCFGKYTAFKQFHQPEEAFKELEKAKQLIKGVDPCKWVQRILAE